MSKFLFAMTCLSISTLIACGGPADRDGGTESTDTDAPTPEQDDVFANKCVSPGAAYSLKFVKTGGNCTFPLPDQVFMIDQDGSVELDPHCKNGPKSRSEGCSVYMDQTCKYETGEVNVWTGKIDWAEDGSGGTGTFSIAATVGGKSCVGTWSTTAARL